MESSPRPWRNGRVHGRLVIENADGRWVGEMNSEQDRAAIILAVNAFDAMREALYTAKLFIAINPKDPIERRVMAARINAALSLATPPEDAS